MAFYTMSSVYFAGKSSISQRSKVHWTSQPPSIHTFALCIVCVWGWSWCGSFRCAYQRIWPNNFPGKNRIPSIDICCEIKAVKDFECNKKKRDSLINIVHGLHSHTNPIVGVQDNGVDQNMPLFIIRVTPPNVVHPSNFPVISIIDEELEVHKLDHLRLPLQLLVEQIIGLVEIRISRMVD